jgi:hypothetical protein
MSQSYDKQTEIKNVLTELGLDNPEYKTEILEVIQFLNESEHFLEAFGSESLKMLWKFQKLTTYISNE